VHVPQEVPRGETAFWEPGPQRARPVQEMDQRTTDDADDADERDEAKGPGGCPATSVPSGSGSDPLLAFGQIVNQAWNQGFRVEETDRGWYFLPPGGVQPCCGIARAQEDDPRVLRSLMKTLREAGLRVVQSPNQEGAVRCGGELTPRPRSDNSGVSAPISRARRTAWRWLKPGTPRS
jgi:hypothetical protein